MKKQIKNLMKKTSHAANNFAAKATVVKNDMVAKLQSTEGDETVSKIVWVIVVIVIIVVLALPKLWKTIEGALDGADTKINDIWNYKG